MHPDDYKALDGLAIANLINTGQVSTHEVAEAALAVIEDCNPRVNAVIESFAQRALDADCREGAFHGVPFLVKDVGPTEEGMLTEMGSRLARGLRASAETPLMTSYKNAGVNLLGRSSSPELAFNISTENLLHGPVRNPCNSDYMVGGSSGGAAAAVAAGMVPIAHANDGGGSIRIPASCCGVFGLKPTRGRISYGPAMGEALHGFSCEHIVSRSVRDSAAMLDLTQGPRPGDPYLLPELNKSFLSALDAPKVPRKIALMTQPWDIARSDPECVQAAEQAARLCEQLGHSIERCDMPLGVAGEDYITANGTIWMCNIAAWIDELAAATGRSIDEQTLEASTLACYHFGKRAGAADYLRAVAIQNQVSRAVGIFFEDYDLLLTPTLPQPPQPLGTFNANAPLTDGMGWAVKLFTASPFTPLFNMTGQPAMSVPLFLNRAGLPIGVQFAARFGAERTLFELAGQLERSCGWNRAVQV